MAAPDPTWTPAVSGVTGTGRHRLQVPGHVPVAPEMAAVGAGPPSAPVVPGGRWQARRDVFRDGRSAFWDTDDWTASARPTVLMRPVRA